ncbi:hypothetical protein TNCV_4815381 [Trichonephila clavipes]|nr:hypothetical protein TNCV_4815381 [Trichonephila clavipes]
MEIYPGAQLAQETATQVYQLSKSSGIGHVLWVRLPILLPYASKVYLTKQWLVYTRLIVCNHRLDDVQEAIDQPRGQSCQVKGSSPDVADVKGMFPVKGMAQVKSIVVQSPHLGMVL